MERTPSPDSTDPRPRCTFQRPVFAESVDGAKPVQTGVDTCGYVAYEKQSTVGNSHEWRCFPHFKPKQGRFRIGERLKTEERYKLAHIDRGFPDGASFNDVREAAYGAELRDPNPARRIGLTR